ncbi:MAG: peptidoglycan-associated lipoprotein Pal [Cardiobacteriaceae bacterium]|nr:peptidoglycan-associated lipoprotein Pal [Cardiobacteriaceae bacterium]
MKVFFGMSALALLAGCSSPYQGEQAGQDGSMYGSTYDAGATYGTDGNPYGMAGGYRGASDYASTADFYQDPMYGVNVVGGPDASARDRIIYFSYDSSSIDSRSEAVIREHANYLRANPGTMVVLEGHTDERGTRDYNIGLGERRAYSVKQAFQNHGVGIQQMRVLSYGEERPAVWGSDELSYAKNRRVVIIY